VGWFVPLVYRIMTPKDVHILISGTYEFDIVHGKGDLRLQMKLKLLISWTGDVRVVLDFPGKPNVTSGSLNDEESEKS
jgi:hypothetical protein